jgi:hypothetical protein
MQKQQAISTSMPIRYTIINFDGEFGKSSIYRTTTDRSADSMPKVLVRFPTIRIPPKLI